MFKYGVCTKVTEISVLEELGFDYIEFGLTGIASLSDEEFETTQRIVEQAGIKAEAFNGMFPGDIKLVGKNRDEGKIVTYLEKALRRMNSLGGKVLVFGSGAARKCGEGEDFFENVRWLADTLRLAADMASQYGIVIAVEPLNRRETNIINSMKEGAMLAAMANRENAGLLSDFYHVSVENEPLTDIEVIRSFKHIHIASKEGRRFPLPGQPDDYLQFFRMLKNAGYDGRISIEGGTDSFREDAKTALAFMKDLEKSSIG